MDFLKSKAMKLRTSLRKDKIFADFQYKRQRFPNLFRIINEVEYIDSDSDNEILDLNILMPTPQNLNSEELFNLTMHSLDPVDI